MHVSIERDTATYRVCSAWTNELSIFVCFCKLFNFFFQERDKQDREKKEREDAERKERGEEPEVEEEKEKEPEKDKESEPAEENAVKTDEPKVRDVYE